MGWRGTMRSISAAANRAEKDAQRRRKQASHSRLAADAADAVENLGKYTENLLSIHIDLTDRIDWEKLLSKPEPKPSAFHPKHHQAALAALVGFKPRMFDFLRGGSAKLLEKLKSDLTAANQLDESERTAAERKHSNTLKEWESDRTLAKRLLAGEMAAIREVVVEMQSLQQTDLIGSSVKFSIGDNFLHARPQVHSDEIIPSIRRKQLASGKLSETKMPVGQFNELYQDYVASVALKVAGDLFHILPLQEIYVTCESDMLNAATGHKEFTPILSVQFIRSTLMGLNLANVDPSDSLSNFNHIMKFSKTKGFSTVVPLVKDSDEPSAN
jgi:hypothetical protein